MARHTLYLQCQRLSGFTPRVPVTWHSCLTDLVRLPTAIFATVIGPDRCRVSTIACCGKVKVGASCCQQPVTTSKRRSNESSSKSRPRPNSLTPVANEGDKARKQRQPPRLCRMSLAGHQPDQPGQAPVTLLRDGQSAKLSCCD